MSLRSILVVGVGLTLTGAAFAQDSAEAAKAKREAAADSTREAKSKIAEAMAKAAEAKQKAQGAKAKAEDAREKAGEARDAAAAARDAAQQVRPRGAPDMSWQQLKESREARRDERKKELKEKWGAKVLERGPVQAELKVHARRKARLARIRALAKEEGKDAVVERVDKLLEKENARHERHMATLNTKAGEQ